MNNLTQRIITGTLFVAIVIGCISWNIYSTAVLFLVLSTLGSIELYQILNKKHLSNNTKYGPVVNVVVYTILTLVFIEHLPYIALIAIIPFFIILVMLELFIKDDIPYQNISSTLFAVLYITLPFAVLNYMSFNEEIYAKIGMEENWNILAGFLIILWTSDSMAYVVGRLIGKHKLFERISPGKTWEGFFGGIILAIGFAALSTYAFFPELPFEVSIPLAIVMALVGVGGDLTESAMKRGAKTKDTANILPGHGGILDRLDSLLFNAPILYYFARFYF